MADVRHDIEKYLKGELTLSERNALERRALDDPFLMEALEGAEQISSADFSLDLQHLQTSLRERTSKRKVISLWSWPARIAAGLTLIALSGYVVMKLYQGDQSNDLALQEKVLPEKPAPIIQEGPAVISDSGTVEEENKVTPAGGLQEPKKTYSLSESAEARSTEKSAPEEKPKLQPATVPGIEVTVAKEEHHNAVSTTESNITNISPSSGELAEQIRKDADQLAQTEDDLSKKISGRAAGVQVQTRDEDKTKNRVLRGRVTDTEGDGLPGVNVLVKGTDVGTITDATGNYEIPVDDKTSELVFSFIGMQTHEEEVTNEGELNVALDQDVSQLSEVVVVGYSGGQKKEEDEEVPTLELAVPAGGRGAYKQYLEKNLRYPEQALENNIEGRVTVQFTVDANGKMVDFNVLKGLGYGCDEEVIRLIKQGPKWNPTKRDTEPVKDKVKVRMRFRLPKKK